MAPHCELSARLSVSTGLFYKGFAPVPLASERFCFLDTIRP